MQENTLDKKMNLPNPYKTDKADVKDTAQFTNDSGVMVRFRSLGRISPSFIR